MSATRDRLINTAERLFALHGLEGVSLDRIRREAGEKNASALQYHFGSKASLLRAVFETRLSVIDQRRLEILSDSVSTDRTLALRGCAEALVLPFAEHLSAPGTERYYVRFVAQVYGDPRTDWSELLAGGRNEGVFQVGRRLSELLPELPAGLSERDWNWSLASLFMGWQTGRRPWQLTSGAPPFLRQRTWDC